MSNSVTNAENSEWSFDFSTESGIPRGGAI